MGYAKTPPHPAVERVVQKQIGQQWADGATLRRATGPGLERAIRQLHRNLQPAPQIKKHPALGGMELEGPKQEVVIDRIEEPLDIEIHHPVILPAALAAALHGLMGRLSRSVAVGILIEDRLQLGLQHLLDHNLRLNAVGRRPLRSVA
jgi:hypothetical protein